MVNSCSIYNKQGGLRYATHSDEHMSKKPNMSPKEYLTVNQQVEHISNK